MRYFLEISYNGKNFHGWQIQKNGISVQQVLNESLSKILGREICVVGAGRTDAGVHANQTFCHFDVDVEIEENFLYKINSVLPLDISVKDFFRVKDDANSRFDAKEREYKYFISLDKNSFCHDFSYYFHRELDIKIMNKACRILKKHKDFKCFSRSNTQVNNFICHINKVYWKRDGRFLIFTISANRFLRNMVRAIVGTMIDLGLKKKTLQNFVDILNSGRRSEAGYSVPPQGLFLNRVVYGKIKK